MRSQLSHLFKVYNWLKPQKICALCLLQSDQDITLCSDCEADLPWQLSICPCCALAQNSSQLCDECKFDEPAFSQVIAPWRFDFPINTLINRFKHKQDWVLGRLLASLLARDLQQKFSEGMQVADALLAMPLSLQRQRERGFNQAQMLAQWLTKPLQRPILNDAVQRLPRQAQQQLNATQRKANLRGVFQLNQNINWHGLHVAIVDDVVTTGATCRELAKQLLNAGVRQVDVYCLARTPKPDYQPKSSSASGRRA